MKNHLDTSYNHDDRVLELVDEWLAETKTAKDKEYEEAFKESDDLQVLLDELDNNGDDL